MTGDELLLHLKRTLAWGEEALDMAEPPAASSIQATIDRLGQLIARLGHGEICAFSLTPKALETPESPPHYVTLDEGDL